MDADHALVLLSFAAVVVLQALLHWSTHPVVRELHVHITNGFYLNALMDRFASTWKSSPRNKETSDAHSESRLRARFAGTYRRLEQLSVDRSTLSAFSRRNGKSFHDGLSDEPVLQPPRRSAGLTFSQPVGTTGAQQKGDYS
jgi:hypothetical protein